MKEVRLTDENGEQVGIVSIQDALARAEEAELDLVEISPNAEPPVCRIMNYGKFIYEKEKAAKEQKKKQKVVQVKEIKFRPGTDEGDYQVKLRSILRFLEDGDKVKITVRFVCNAFILAFLMPHSLLCFPIHKIFYNSFRLHQHQFGFHTQYSL